MKLRDYQQDILDRLLASRSNDLVQLDTGAGKTPIEAALAQQCEYGLLVAHRNILIEQISEKLAAFGLAHDTISTEHTRRRCMAAHARHGASFIQRGHKTRLVASMQSIVAALRHHRFTLNRDQPWTIIIDEAHHVIPDNMWGKLRELFPSARIVGFTATPARMDGESLHVDRGGLFDNLIVGKYNTRELIDVGYLSDYVAYAPREATHYLKAGDGEKAELELAGDPVLEYQRKAAGTRAIVMAPSIVDAREMADAFREAGIAAACINSTQGASDITRTLQAFRAGRIQVLTNVDMVGEGFDLPACETLIIANRTASFPRYRQWCGRVLRPDPTKQQAVIIDLTGMCAVHGVPDEPVTWDLLKPPRVPQSLRHVPCDDCGAYFPVKLDACPHCGWENEWLDRPAGFAVGTSSFDIRVLDGAELYRLRQIRDERRRNELLHSILQTPTLHTGGAGAVGRAVERIAHWFYAQLEREGVPIIDLNNFMAREDVKRMDFWIDNFSVGDVGNTKKAMKVWQRTSR